MPQRKFNMYWGTRSAVALKYMCHVMTQTVHMQNSECKF